MADTLGLLSNIAQVVDLLIRVGVMCSVYCMDVKNAPQDVRRILKEADKLTATLKDVERLIDGPNGAKLEASPGLRQTILDCRTLLSGLVAKLDLGAKYTRAVWPFKKRDVNEITLALERHKATITLHLNIEQTVVLLDIHQETVLLKLRVAEAATFDSSMDGDESKCLPGTRIDIIEQIQHWSTDPRSEPIFWLNGMAGTGKSTISRTISESFSTKGILGASFFFKRGEGDRSRTSFFFTTIAAQLVRKIPSLAPHVRDAIEADPTIHEKSMGHQFEELILDPLKKVSARWQSPSIVVVIDALDECDHEESMRVMIGVLAKARSLTTPRLKFFLTSRPELPIRLGFQEMGGKYDGLLLAQIPKPIIEHDIAAFMRHQIQGIRADYNMSVTANRKLSSDWPGEESIQKLVAMAIPLFIVAATMCRFLKDRRLGGPQNQLSRILDYQNMSTSRLDLTYLPVLDRLIAGLSQSDQHDVISTFKYYVGSIVTLAQPLSIMALASLLEVPPEVIEDHLDLLHSVLSVPSDTIQPVRLLHLSFRDFLVDPDKKNDQIKYPFWVDEQATHVRLFSQCLKLLSTSGHLKEDLCSLRLPGVLRSDVNPRIIDECLPSEVQYACLFWVYHLKSSACTIRDGDLTHQFLKSHLLHWLEALSLLGRLPESRAMIDSLLDNLTLKESQALSRLLKDIRRIILTNMAILDRAPLQIYTSVLIFAPENSVVRSIFKNSIPSWISSLPKVHSDWDPCLVTLEGHKKQVVRVVVCPKGERIASLSHDASVKIWDIQTAVCLSTHKHARFFPLKFSSDGTNLMYLSGHDVLEIWDTLTGGCISTFKGHTDEITRAEFSPDGSRLISASRDNTIKIWDRNGGNCIITVPFLYTSEHLGDFSPDGTKFIVTNEHNIIKLFDIATARPVATYTVEDPKTLIKSVIFSPDSQKLVWTESGGNLRMHNLLSGTCSTKARSCYIPNEQLVFFSDSIRLVTGMKGHSLGVLDTTSLTYEAKFDGHGAAICRVRLTADEARIASASIDNTIKIWHVASGVCTMTFRGHHDFIQDMTFSIDEMLLISGSDDGSLKIWDITASNDATVHDGHNSAVIEVIFSPDESKVMTAAADRTLKIWDTMTRECIATGEGHQSFAWVPLVMTLDVKSAPFDNLMREGGLYGWPRSATFSPDSLRLVSRAFVGRDVDFTREGLNIWDATTGGSLMLRESHVVVWGTRDGEPASITFSPDGSSLTVAYRGGFAKCWNVMTGDLIATFGDESQRVSSATCSSDGTMLVSACRDGAVRIWRASTDNCMIFRDGDEEGAERMAELSADGTKLASVSTTGLLKIWDVTTGACVATHRARGLDMDRMVFSPNNDQLAILYESGQYHLYRSGQVSISLWSALTGQPIANLEICRLVNHMEFDSTGSRLFTNVGTYTITACPSNHSQEEPVETPIESISNASPIVIGREGIGLSVDAVWVTWNSENILWLPPTYRPSASDIRVAESTIVIGSRSGHVLFIGLEPSKLPKF